MEHTFISTVSRAGCVSLAAKLAEQHITVDQMANHILLIISKIISGEKETPVNYIFVPHSEVLENKWLFMKITKPTDLSGDTFACRTQM